MIDELEARGEAVIGFYANIGKFHNPVYADFAFLENPNVPVILTKEGSSVLEIDSSQAQNDEAFDFRTSTFIDMCQ